MLKPQAIPPVPEMTARAAHAAFPKGHRYLTLRDNLGTIFSDEMFAGLFPTNGRPAEAPWRLALVTVVQHAEGLSDREAADAVRDRVTLRYLLGLDYDDPGFDYSILSRFRDRLVEGNAEHLILDALVEASRKAGLLKDRGKVRTDSTHVLASVRELSRLEFVGETLRHALNEIAKVAPDWLRALAPNDWYTRYARGFVELPLRRKSKQGPNSSEQVGQDGLVLMRAVYSPEAPAELRDLPAVELLRRCWVQEFVIIKGEISMRFKEDLAPAPLRMRSPYDVEMRYGMRGATSWEGYRVHFTETCDDDTPHLLVHTDTTAAPVADLVRVTPIHEALKAKEIRPGQHFVDNNYVTSKLLVHSKKDYGVSLVGPIKAYRAYSGFGTDRFDIDWEREVVTCPAGKQSIHWTPRMPKSGREQIAVGFAPADCKVCPLNKQCAKNTMRAGRTLTLLPREQHEAREKVRQLQTTEEWTATYNIRQGCEGTFSQGMRLGLRVSRYHGLKKTHLRNLAVAAGINLQRLGDWFGDSPRAKTRTSRFAALRA